MEPLVGQSVEVLIGDVVDIFFFVVVVSRKDKAGP
jgi:hypothetical protein